MTPLIILLLSFGSFFLIDKFLLKQRFGFSFVGRAVLAVMLLATGIAHFTSTDLMIQMMPDFIPAKRELVYLTGICELLGALGLLWNATARLTAIMLIVFFVAILPANIIGSMKQVRLGGMENGEVYLFFRIPLQMLFIGWTYYFGIYRLKRDS